MRPPKYPLEPLAGLREKMADEAVREVAEATRERTAAERRSRASEQQVAAHDAAAERLRRGEREALARGELRVADLARANDWETQISAQRATLATALSRARVEEASALAREDGARRQATSRKADAQVVINDRARWRESQRKRAEAKEEEASSEAWRPVKS
jgi:hypothetical protein